MHAARLLWFFLWRMVLQGLVLGAGLGTLYGLLLGGMLFPYGLGFVIVGPLFGTVGGPFVGAVGGVILFVATFLRRSNGERRYRTVSGLACAVAGVLTMISSCEIAFRASGLGSLASEVMFERYMVETLFFVVFPAIGAGCAMWWAGRRVAEKYIDEFHEPAGHGPTDAAGRTLVEQKRRR